MLMNLEQLVDKYDMDIRGVIHIGAYTGNEYIIYKEAGIEYTIFFEPQLDAYNILVDRVKHDVKVEYGKFALGNFNGKAKMYVASNGQSSTLLEPYLHKEQYPDITFDREIEVNVLRLDDIGMSGDYNFINIDAEGYELKVFKGATKTLKKIDYIMTEVAVIELQKGRVLVKELDEFLSDFLRVDTIWTDKGWGDALYIRK